MIHDTRHLLGTVGLALALCTHAVRASDGASLAAVPLLPPGVEVPRRAAAGDVDGDDITDLVIRRWNTPLAHDIVLLRGRGDGSFEPPTQLVDLLGSSYEPFAVGLFEANGDGHLDLYQVPYEIRLGDGTGAFGSPIPMPWDTLIDPLQYPFGRAADVNADGLMDVLISGHALGQPPVGTGAGKDVIALLADGSGGVAPIPGQMPLRTDFHPGARVADLNGDGFADIYNHLYVGTPEYEIRVHHGLGDGSFTPTSTLIGLSPPHSYSRITSGDMNADGLVDIVMGTYDHSTFSSSLEVFLNSPSGALDPLPALPLSVPATSYNEPIDLELADMTGDGHLDAMISFADVSSPIVLAKGAGDGTLVQAGSTSGLFLSSLVTADVDGDGTGECLAFPSSSSSGLTLIQGSPDAFVDIGLGAGTVGLEGEGCTAADCDVDLTLSGTTAPMAAWIFSLGAQPLALAAGTLGPDLVGSGGLIVVAPTAQPLELTWPVGIPEGTAVYAQALAFGQLSNSLAMLAR